LNENTYLNNLRINQKFADLYADMLFTNETADEADEYDKLFMKVVRHADNFKVIHAFAEAGDPLCQRLIENTNNSTKTIEVKVSGFVKIID